MSPLAAPLATLLFFSGFVAAEAYAPPCTVASWAWTLNSLGQNACGVAAYLMATCHGGSFTINGLGPGYKFWGPNSVDASDLCQCNTITYSLMSACGACKGADWITWSEYSFNCTRTLPPSTFPNSIPSETRVPQWALIDITSENNWNPDKAFAVGDSPEQLPGTRLGTSPESGSNTGTIVGSVVGGVGAISLVFAAVFFLCRRRREAPALVALPVVGASASQPSINKIQQPLTMDDGCTAPSIPGTIGSSPMPGTPLAPMRNDPNYPSTFPGYQGIPQTPATPAQGAVPSPNRAGNNLATVLTSR